MGTSRMSSMLVNSKTTCEMDMDSTIGQMGRVIRGTGLMTRKLAQECLHSLTEGDTKANSMMTSLRVKVF